MIPLWYSKFLEYFTENYPGEAWDENDSEHLAVREAFHHAWDMGYEDGANDASSTE